MIVLVSLIVVVIVCLGEGERQGESGGPFPVNKFFTFSEIDNFWIGNCHSSK